MKTAQTNNFSSNNYKTQKSVSSLYSTPSGTSMTNSNQIAASYLQSNTNKGDNNGVYVVWRSNSSQISTTGQYNENANVWLILKLVKLINLIFN